MLLGALLLLAVPAARACGDTQVVPLVDLEFPEKSACREDAPCDPLPGHGASERYEGSVKWSWDVDQCTVQNGLPGGEVRIQIGPTSSTPDWMRVRADPEEVVITTQEQVDPRNLHVEDVGGATRVYFQVEKSVAVTFTRVGALDDEDADRIEGRDGLLPLFLKAQSQSATASMASFGVEEFRFDASVASDAALAGRPADARQESTPWPLPMTGLALLGAVLVARRR